MGGAAAHLLIPALDAVTLATWNRIVDSVSAMRNGNDFWVMPRGAVEGTALPFFWEPVDEAGMVTAYQDFPGVVTEIERTFGCVAGAAILIVAMCRGRASDLILADLCLALMKEGGAVLEFSGLLTPPLSVDQWRAWETLTPEVQSDTFIHGLGVFPGRLHAFPLREAPASHAVDAEFLEFWREHPAFHFPN